MWSQDRCSLNCQPTCVVLRGAEEPLKYCFLRAQKLTLSFLSEQSCSHVDFKIVATVLTTWAKINKTTRLLKWLLKRREDVMLKYKE